jgi:hypothetical protein
MMCTCSGFMPKVLATSPTVQAIIWFDVQRVSASPFQAAIEACGSIIAWL